MNSPRHPLSALLLCGLLLLIPNAPAQAGSATWNLNPTSGDWFNTTNWTPATIPDGPTQIATFRASGITDVTMHPSPTGFDQLDSIVFQNGASPFTIRPQFLEVGGAGISNLSGLTQNFVNDVYLNSISLLVGSRITFSGNASAGVQCTYTNNPGAIPNTNPSAVIFVDDANAGSSVFINNASATSDSTGAGVVFFENNSSAAQATIINNGGTGAALSGATVFFDTSTADAATIVVNGSSGGTIGGVISFATDSTGGTAAVRLNGDGTLSLGDHNPPGVTIGSLEGDGVVLLASNNLTIGTNNSSRTFSGTIADGDGFSGGSLTKVGTAKLTLTSANTYTGGTTINAGTLFVTNRSGSGTGSGQVQISGGKLGGTGKIAGNVIVGNGSLPEAFLSPGIANGYSGYSYPPEEGYLSGRWDAAFRI